MYYFAYGSNMSLKRLQARVPSARPVGLAHLEAHQLRFHKRGKDDSAKADAYLTGDSSDRVVGVLFIIDPDEKHHLDRAEGLGFGYDIKEVELAFGARGTITAFTYFAIHIDPSLKPYHWYKHHVISGAKEAGLPFDYQHKIEQFSSVTDPDAERHAREMNLYKN